MWSILLIIARQTMSTLLLVVAPFRNTHLPTVCALSRSRQSRSSYINLLFTDDCLRAPPQARIQLKHRSGLDRLLAYCQACTLLLVSGGLVTMARIKQTARRLTGGRAPRKRLARDAVRKFVSVYRDRRLYEVYVIVDHCEDPNGKLEYKVQWRGEEYIDADTWEPRFWLLRYKSHRQVKIVDE